MNAAGNTKRFLYRFRIDDALEQHIGDVYQQVTKYHPDDVGGGRRRPVSSPGVYKTYPDALKVVPLPEPVVEDGPGLWEVLRRRRSVREFADVPLSMEELSQVLWAAQGITARVYGYDLRTAPSAGALYPVETYLVVHRVDGLDAGVYHYAVPWHRLECLKAGDFRRQIAEALLGQGMAADAGIVFVWTAVTARSKAKYAERAYRYIYLDAGHIGAHVALAAEALALGSCAIGALFDDLVNDIIGVDGVEETVVYATVVGKRRKVPE